MENVPPGVDSHGKGRDNNQKDAALLDKDKNCEQTLSQTDRKLRSLLELGQIIGLDLQIDDMLVQIAKKATKVMEADRFTIFLYDPNTDELWSKVALGMWKREIRIPSDVGVAGHCFKTGKTVILNDAQNDPRFYKEFDAITGYKTKSLLSVPFYGRSGQLLGVIQLLNKKAGVFTEEDETFLKTFNNHASVFIEMAQLQKARIDALKQSQAELERLSRAKGKALDHLAHELRTPLAIIQGTIKLLKRKLLKQAPHANIEGSFEILEKYLTRLFETQNETDKILRTYHELEGGFIVDELDRLWRRVGDTSKVPTRIKTHFNVLKEWLVKQLPDRSISLKQISLFPFIQQRLGEVRQLTSYRDLKFQLDGRQDLSVFMDPGILRDLIIGLLKNAIENTPDEGTIRITLEQTNQKILIKIQDFGIGITEENKAHIFDGLFHTQDTDLYGSKKPYDFNAGGKGLDLLLMKIYGQRFGFDLSVESKRCIYIPTDKDLCPGTISLCPHCQKIEDCTNSGGSTFCVSFPITEQNITGNEKGLSSSSTK
jgi:signal transduction histidine kinase